MINAIICGSCVVDLPCLTVDLATPIGADRTFAIDPIQPSCGGLTCNVAVTMRRLGMSPGVLSLVGDDAWGGLVRAQLDAEGVSHSLLRTHHADPTTAVVVLVDGSGERSFLAPATRTATKSIDAAFLAEHADSIAPADWFVLGYFGRMPALEPQLGPALEKIRASGVRTVMDAGGDGGRWVTLQPALPHLDVFVPSLCEAQAHTGLADPAEILARYRECGAPGVIGVKLGAEGALLGAAGSDGDWLHIPPAAPPGEIVDTTGAGDAFLAGLVTGLDQGLELPAAGRLAAAAGACAITARGGYAGVPDGRAVWKMAGLA